MLIYINCRTWITSHCKFNCFIFIIQKNEEEDNIINEIETPYGRLMYILI